MSQFSSALQSGQLGPIVSQFAVNPDAVSAAAQGNMREFVRALERSNTSTESKPDGDNKNDKDDKKKPAEKGNEPKKDDDEGMQLD